MKASGIHPGDLRFNKVKSLSVKPAKALSLGANRVKSPSCFSRSVKSAASIRDKKILQCREEKRKKTKNSHLAWTETTEYWHTATPAFSFMPFGSNPNPKNPKKCGLSMMLYFNPTFHFLNIALYLLKPSFFCQNLIHRFFRRFQKDLHEMKGPITSLLTASDQTGILNANSLPLQSTS